MSKRLKLDIWITFIMYIILLVDILVLKHGTALIIASSLRGRTWFEKIETINFIPFKTILEYLNGSESFTISLQNILGNIISFSPLGFLLPILVRKLEKVKTIICIAILLSLLIEISQLIFNLGSCDIDDIILNTLGAVIGFILFKIINKQYLEKLYS